MIVVVALFTGVPLWAAEESTGATQEWVLSYATIILFLTLALLILLRPIQRNDSAFSHDELQAQKDEEMKKIKNAR